MGWNRRCKKIPFSLPILMSGHRMRQVFRGRGFSTKEWMGLFIDIMPQKGTAVKQKVCYEK